MGESLLFWFITHFWCAAFQYPGGGASYVPCPLPRSRSSIMSWIQDIFCFLPLSEMQFFLGLCPNVEWICYFPPPLKILSRDNRGGSRRGAHLSHCGCGLFLPQPNHMRRTFLVPCYAPDLSHNHSISSLGKSVKVSVNSHCGYSSHRFHFLTVAIVRL